MLLTSSVPAHDGKLAPSLEVSGRSSLFDDGRTTVTPIFTVAFGDVARAERMARQWQTYGPNGLDAVIWTPVDSPRGLWKATDFRRPKTTEEFARFTSSPELFRTDRIGAKDILPHPFNRLRDEGCRTSNTSCATGREGSAPL